MESNRRDVPGLIPPPVVTPDFDDPPNLLTLTITLITLMSIIILLAVGSRLYTKAVIIRKMTLEDYVLLSAFIVYATAYLCTVAFLIRFPIGVHQWNVLTASVAHFKYLLNTTMIVYSVLVFLIKLSIILQYLRIFCTLRTPLYWTLHILIWLHLVFYVTFILLVGLICRRRASECRVSMKGRCSICLPLNLWAAGLNTISDFLLLIIPQCVIWKSGMKADKKRGLSALFLIGIVALASTCMRFYYGSEIRRTGDATHAGSLMAIWTLPEITAGFLVICLPVMPKLLKHAKHQGWGMANLGIRIRALLGHGDGQQKPDRSPVEIEEARVERGGEPRNVVLTDPEFHDLVQVTSRGTV